MIEEITKNFRLGDITIKVYLASNEVEFVQETFTIHKLQVKDIETMNFEREKIYEGIFRIYLKNGNQITINTVPHIDLDDIQICVEYIKNLDPQYEIDKNKKDHTQMYVLAGSAFVTLILLGFIVFASINGSFNNKKTYTQMKKEEIQESKITPNPDTINSTEAKFEIQEESFDKYQSKEKRHLIQVSMPQITTNLEAEAKNKLIQSATSEIGEKNCKEDRLCHIEIWNNQNKRSKYIELTNVVCSYHKEKNDEDKYQACAEKASDIKEKFYIGLFDTQGKMIASK